MRLSDGLARKLHHSIVIMKSLIAGIITRVQAITQSVVDDLSEDFWRTAGGVARRCALENVLDQDRLLCIDRTHLFEASEVESTRLITKEVLRSNSAVNETFHLMGPDFVQGLDGTQKIAPSTKDN